MSIAIYDIDKSKEKNFSPFCINHASFEIKVGLLSNFDRIKKTCIQNNINIEKIYLIVRQDIEGIIQERYPECIVNPKEIPDVDTEFSGNCILLNYNKKNEYLIENIWDVFKYNDIVFRHDVSTYKKTSNFKVHESTILINKDRILINENTKISAGSILDPKSNDDFIVLGKNVNIDSGSIIQGNVFIDDNSYIAPGSKIKSGTYIGKNCKIGGEVSNSIFCDYSNKVHDGFLGHSFVGEWVNIGAGTNNSNLKNNYSTVRFPLGNKEFVETNEQFLGVYIGDYSRIGISTMFNTGSYVGIGSNVFGGGFQNKYIPNFAWANKGTVHFDKFLETCKRMKKRRDKEMTDTEIEFLKKIYDKNS